MVVRGRSRIRSSSRSDSQIRIVVVHRAAAYSRSESIREERVRTSRTPCTAALSRLRPPRHDRGRPRSSSADDCPNSRIITNRATMRLVDVRRMSFAKPRSRRSLDPLRAPSMYHRLVDAEDLTRVRKHALVAREVGDALHSILPTRSSSDLSGRGPSVSVPASRDASTLGVCAAWSEAPLSIVCDVAIITSCGRKCMVTALSFTFFSGAAEKTLLRLL